MATVAWSNSAGKIERLRHALKCTRTTFPENCLASLRSPQSLRQGLGGTRPRQPLPLRAGSVLGWPVLGQKTATCGRITKPPSRLGISHGKRRRTLGLSAA